MHTFNWYYVWALVALIAMYFLGRRKYCWRNGIRQYVAEYTYVVLSGVLGAMFALGLFIESHDGILQAILDNGSESPGLDMALYILGLSAIYGIVCLFASLEGGERQRRLLKKRHCGQKRRQPTAVKAVEMLPPSRRSIQ
ncbi:hypothetical protein J6X73_00650 [Candidatus Saccharibacteria bacterium]|nr:hypothetical protein [Candidatus Saccharibacteria bacterium]